MDCEDLRDLLSCKGTALSAASESGDRDAIPNRLNVLTGFKLTPEDRDIDADGDGFSEWEERLRGSDPNDPNSIPASMTIYVATEQLYDWEAGASAAVPGTVEDGTVGHPFHTIQQGIDAAISGDTVLVAEGTYSGLGNRDINLSGKAITVAAESEAYGPGRCTIDCQYLGRGLVFTSGETADTVVCGFTIVHGFADLGAGIYCSASSPRIRHCVLAGNIAQVNGGGVYCQGGSLSLEHMTISRNQAILRGGGICCDGAETMHLYQSIVWENLAGVDGFDLCIMDSLLSARTSMATLAYCDLRQDHPALCVGSLSTISATCCLAADPLFADANGGDFHLRSQMGRWCAQEATWIQDDKTSLCIDAGDPNTGTSQEVWPHGLRANIGAFGGTLEASLSLSVVGSQGDLRRDAP